MYLCLRSCNSLSDAYQQVFWLCTFPEAFLLRVFPPVNVGSDSPFLLGKIPSSGGMGNYIAEG